MNLLRHILSYLLLFFVLVAIGLSYYFRPVIFPQAVNTKINALVESVYPPALKVVYVAAEQKEITAGVEVAPVVKAESPQVVVAESTEPQPIETAVPVVEEQPVDTSIEQNVQTDIALVKEKSVANAIPEKTPAVIVKPQVVDKVEKVKVPASVAESTPPEVANAVTEREAGAEQRLLADARQAYQQKDLATAISKYRQLIALDEHSANAFGEMGNIYYLQGKWQEAGAAYYEAAVRLVENGQMQQVAYLHRVIQGLDPAKAEQLAVKMNHGRM